MAEALQDRAIARLKSPFRGEPTVERYLDGEDRKQVTLFPDCLEDFINKDNLVSIIDAFLRQASGRRHYLVPMG